MTQFITQFLADWGSSIGYSLATAAIMALASLLVYLAPKVVDILINLAESIKSDKIRIRLQDALGKLKMVLVTLMNSEHALLKKEVQIALADGKIDSDEMKAIAKKLASEAINMLTPETATLKKFLAGDMLGAYVEKMATAYMVEWAQQKLGKKIEVGADGVPFEPRG